MPKSTGPFPRHPLPEPGSLQQLIASHPRKRLYVHPAFWQATHLDLLECHVSSKPVLFNTNYVSSMPSILSEEVYMHVYRSMTKAEPVDFKDVHVRILVGITLETLQVDDISHPRSSLTYEEVTYSNLRFIYGSKRVASIACAALAFRETEEGQSFAFIDRSLRYNMVAYEKERKSAQVTSRHFPDMRTVANLPIDPCHVAILIAMAQRLHRKSSSQGPARVNLITTSEDREKIVLYTADVSRRYVAKFLIPKAAQNEELQIDRLEMPLGNFSNALSLFNHVFGGC